MSDACNLAAVLNVGDMTQDLICIISANQIIVVTAVRI